MKVLNYVNARFRLTPSQFIAIVVFWTILSLLYVFIVGIVIDQLISDYGFSRKAARVLPLFAVLMIIALGVVILLNLATFCFAHFQKGYAIKMGLAWLPVFKFVLLVGWNVQLGSYNNFGNVILMILMIFMDAIVWLKQHSYFHLRAEKEKSELPVDPLFGDEKRDA